MEGSNSQGDKIQVEVTHDNSNTPSNRNEGKGDDMKDTEDGDEEQEGVFEIEDYTTASPWERFVSKIEQALYSWGLSTASQKRQAPVKAHRVNKKEVTYLGVSYILELHQSPADSKIPVFPTRAHHLTKWFGVKSFLVLGPSAGAGTLDESQGALLLSSLVLAMGNIKCNIPGFVSVLDKDRGAHRGYRISYDDPVIPEAFAFSVDRVTEPQPSYQHITGLVDLFEAKVPSRGREPVNACAKFTYVLDNGDVHWYALTTQDTRLSRDLYILWDASDPDPVASLHIGAIWPAFIASDVTDTSVYSDLDPRTAPQWTLRLIDRPGVTAPVAALFRRLTNAAFKAPTSAASSAVGGLARGDDGNQDGAVDGRDTPTHRAAELLQTVGQVTRSVTASLNAEAPPDPAEIDLALQELFEPAYYDLESDMIRDAPRSVPKTCPMGTLTSNLAIHAIKQPGLRAILTLFHEFVRELRWHWDHAVPLPGFADASPNMAACMIHQKLEMLAVCILKRAAAGEGARKDSEMGKSKEEVGSEATTGTDNGHGDTSAGPTGEEGSEGSDGSEGGDAFHDTIEEHDNAVTHPSDSTSTAPATAPTPSPHDASDTDYDSDVEDAFEDDLNRDRQGAEQAFGDLMLLRTGHALHVPQVQNHNYLTEDMMMEQQEVLSSLGTSEMGTRIRAQMQSASVRSDMQAFKAANPGAVLEDFVRWHSPRDFLISSSHPREGTIEGDTDDATVFIDVDACVDSSKPIGSVTVPPKTRVVWHLSQGQFGYLSNRMADPGNLWHKIWRRAHAISVHEQVSLFDHTREGEKALHYFETIGAADLMSQLLRVGLSGMLFHLREYSGTQGLGPVDACFDELHQLIASVYASDDNPDQAALTAIGNAIEEAEIMAATALSLLHKLPGLGRLVCELSSNGIADVQQGEERAALSELLTQSAIRAHRGSAFAKDSFPIPDAREIILSRGKARLYSHYTLREFRLATTVPADG